MTGRSPARLLAPLALALTAIAFFAIIASGGGDDSSPETTSRPVATATPTATPTPEEEPDEPARSYTVQPGDTPSSIAEEEGVDVDELLEANPDIDPTGLTVGQELELP